MSIDYVPDQEIFKVFLRIYYDDFLLDSGINSAGQKNLDFSMNSPYTQEVMASYINNRITISINNKQIPAKLGEMNLSENELRMNWVFSSTRKVSSITVKNLVMTSLYSDQANMIIVKVNDFEKGVKLTAEETEKTFKIN
jgi:hypothetical protein